MAGSGSRFAAKGATRPKPLIRVAGRSLIEWSLQNLASPGQVEWLFIVRHQLVLGEPELIKQLQAAGPTVDVHELVEATPSPVHTLNEARRLWQDAGILLIANCDQAMTVPLQPWVAAFEQSAADIGVLTVESPDAHFVHVAVDAQNRVSRMAGKITVNLPAAAGYYLFRSGAILADLIEHGLSAADRSRELCVTDLIGAALARQMQVCAWSLGGVGEIFFPLGDPAYVARYEPQLLKL